MTALYIFAAYIIGSIPFGLILARQVKKIDIREHGSKNIGATNVFRVCGKGLGITVFLLDMLKGLFAVILPGIVSNLNLALNIQLLLGVMAILGHTFPIWLKFKGGKGVATSLGVFLAISPLPTAVAFLIFLVAFLASRILSLGSIAASIAFPLSVFLFNRYMEDWIWLQVLSCLLTVFMFYTHRSNLKRLMRGEEKKLF